MSHLRRFRLLSVGFATTVAAFILIAGCQNQASRDSSRDTNRPTTTPAFNREIQLAAFDELFSRISESYFKPERLRAGEDGIDWDGIKARLRPRVENATTVAEVHSAMMEALEALGETHFAIVPSELYASMRESPSKRRGDESNAKPADSGSVGIQVRMVEGVPIVWRVEKESPAAESGIMAGWKIQSIDGEELKPGIDELRRSFGDVALTNARADEWIESKLTPPVGETVRIGLETSGHKHRTFSMRSATRSGTWASFGNLPAMNLRFESRKIPGEIGYFALSVFLNPPKVMPAYAEFIKQNQQSRGVIIDLRGNPGGLGAMATGMCGFLIGEEGKKLGTMIRKDGKLDFVVNPRYPQFTGPVAVLIDQMSMSTSEILASGLKDLGRARIFGQPSPGAALPSTITRLSNGDGLQYALADYISASGQRLEGQGVMPDELIPLVPAELEVGHDRVLDAACAWILGESTSATGSASSRPAGVTE